MVKADKSNKYATKKDLLKTLQLQIENPFQMPPDTDIFILREKEKQQKALERERNKTLKVHEKLTHNQKLIEGMKAGLRPVILDEDDKEDEVVSFLDKMSGFFGINPHI